MGGRRDSERPGAGWVIAFHAGLVKALHRISPLQCVADGCNG
jgi:hypothetical protein